MDLYCCCSVGITYSKSESVKSCNATGDSFISLSHMNGINGSGADKDGIDRAFLTYIVSHCFAFNIALHCTMEKATVPCETTTHQISMVLPKNGGRGYRSHICYYLSTQSSLTLKILQHCQASLYFL
jgi:hypothetical protein